MRPINKCLSIRSATLSHLCTTPLSWLSCSSQRSSAFPSLLNSSLPYAHEFSSITLHILLCFILRHFYSPRLRQLTTYRIQHFHRALHEAETNTHRERGIHTDKQRETERITYF